MIEFSDDTLFLDIETHSVTERYGLPPWKFFRLGQWAWGEGEVQTTTDYDEFMSVMDSAWMMVAHNGHAFDWSTMYGVKSLKPLHLAREGRLFDTLIHATLANPAPFGTFVDHTGTNRKCTKPEDFRKWYSLANQGHSLGVDGKLFDLSDLAERYEFEFHDQYSEKTGKLLKAKRKVRRDVCCGYGHIPQDDPDFVAYAKQDIVALRNVARALLERMPYDEYARRAQMIMAICAQVSRNGFRVDQDLMLQRIKDMAEAAAWTLKNLNESFGFPIDSKKPIATKAGKEALARAFGELGVPPERFDTTASGAVSWSGDSVKKAAGYRVTDHGLVRPQTFSATQGAALDLADSVALLAGQRSLAELTQASLFEDGLVHPDIMPLQRSGRCSTTNPGLTIWDPSHKDYYIPYDPETQVLVSFDFSNADARAVAAESGDEVYAERFEPGADGHMINAIAAWGEEKVASDPAFYRTRAKAPGHGWGYGIGWWKLSQTTGLPAKESKTFLANMDKKFKKVKAWRDRVAKQAERLGYVINSWGRKMPVEPGREYTQASALYGQGDTNELLFDGLMRLPDRLITRVCLTVHDEVIACLDKATVVEDSETMVRCFSTVWKPRDGGRAIEFPLSAGEPGANWKEATH